MNETSVGELKPFLSVMIIIFTLFLIVFVKMEVRRMGYLLWKQARVEKTARETHRHLSVTLAAQLGPDRIHELAKSKLDLRRAHFGQIIQMTSQKIALQQ